MRSSAKFWDKVAEKYAAKPIEDQAAYEEKLRVTREYLRPDSDVLEFGCGSGGTARLHAPLVRKIDAIDVSASMLEIARRKAGEAGVENINFTRSGIEEFEAPDESYDVVLGLSILHLLGDLDGVLGKVQRLLKPGGVFVSSTTCLDDGYRFLRIVEPIGRLFGFMPPLTFFSKRALVGALERAGFEILHEWQPGKGKAVFLVARKNG